MAAEGSLQGQHTSHSNGNIANHFSFFISLEIHAEAQRNILERKYKSGFISNLFTPLGDKRLIVYLGDYVFNTNPSQHLNQR